MFNKKNYEVTVICARIYIESAKTLMNAVDRGEGHHRRPSDIVQLGTQLEPMAKARKKTEVAKCKSLIISTGSTA